MMGSKLNLSKGNWIETIFDGRNKKYGAYELRAKQSRRTIVAFIIGALFFALLVSTPLISKQIGKNREAREVLDEQITMVDLLPPPPVDDQLKEIVPPPPPPQEVKSLKDVKKFTPPVVAPEEEVVEEMVSQEVLKTADAGRKDVEGSEDGEVVINEIPAEETKTVEHVITEEEVQPLHLVQVKPDYPGGMAKFYEFISQNYVVPEIGHLTEARIYVSFVVEKDGSITDIKVLRDVGYGTGKEAIRVLSKMPKWSPGIQNGRPVRVSYQLPIVLQIL